MHKATNVSTPSPAVESAEAKRFLCRTLMGGTPAMIAAGTALLPPHPGELEGGATNKNYTSRLNANILTNYLSQTVDKQVGKIFSKPITLGDNVPEDIAALCENVDLQGRNLDSFAMDVCKSAFVDGISYIMADWPKTKEVTTQADEKSIGARPYAVHVKAENILEILSEQINGVETITRVRIKECLSVPSDDWGYTELEQVRVWHRDAWDGVDKPVVWWELYREDEKKEQWVKVDESITKFPCITLIPLYTNRTGFMQGLPPNQNVAELNLRHWRSMSEQIWATTFGRFGMLAATGIDPESATGVGPGKKLAASAPEAKFYIVEPTGKGVEMGRLDLESIEKAIETASATLRVERGGTVTATAAMIDSNETNAGMKAIAGGVKDSLETMLMYFAELMGKGPDAGGEVVVCTDFGEAKGTQAGLTSLDKALALGELTGEDYLSIMKWRSELPEDFDIGAAIERAQSAGPPLASMTKKPTIPQNNDTGVE